MAYKQRSPLPIANGGTNATSMTNTDGVVYYDGTSLVTTAVGTATNILTSNGAGLAPTFQAAPSTSISITGNTGGALTGTAFTFTGGTTGLSFGGSGTTETLTFAGITANAGVVALGTDATDNAINIGTAASAGRTITVGNTTGSSGIIEKVGTGNYVLDGVTNSTYAIGASTTTGTITIGGASMSGALTLGNSAQTIFLNSSSNAASIRIGYNQTAGSIFLGHNMTTGTIELGSTAAQTGTISIAPGTGVQTVNIANAGTGVKTVNIATGAVANVVALGSTTASATTTLNAPAGGLIANGVAGNVVANKNYVTINTSTGALGSDNAPLSSISITGDTGGALTGSSFTFAGGTTGLSFGGSGSTETLTFAGITANGGTVSLATDATTSTVNVGTGAGVKTVTLGSTNTTSSLTLNFGGSVGSALSTYISSGSFTPGVSFGGGTTGITYSAQNGTYTRIGSIIVFELLVILTSKGSSTGNAAITGLPVAIAGSPGIMLFSCLPSNITYVGSLVAVGNSTSIQLQAPVSASTPTIISNVGFANNSNVYISGAYLV